MGTDYFDVTEIAGDEVSREQVDRLCNRYFWAGEYCKGKDVVEVACGTGAGLGYLAGLAKSVEAGDYSERITAIAKGHYGDRISIETFDAQNMPFGNACKDVILIFEALYYIPDADRFMAECHRVLRPDGQVLVVTANKDLFDFNPSPHSTTYLGVRELSDGFARHSFATSFFGDTPVDKISARQKVLRPIKKLAVMAGLMPKSMAGKKFLKRIVFGGLVSMPVEIDETTAAYCPPQPISGDSPDQRHKVIYCVAQKM